MDTIRRIGPNPQSYAPTTKNANFPQIVLGPFLNTLSHVTWNKGWLYRFPSYKFTRGIQVHNQNFLKWISLNHIRSMLHSYRNQSIDLYGKSIDSFLYKCNIYLIWVKNVFLELYNFSMELLNKGCLNTY